MVVGDTGAGKTSLCRYLAIANALTAEDKERALDLFKPSSSGSVGTTKPSSLSLNTSNGTLRIVDTPGLDDADGRDAEYLAMLTKDMRDIRDCGAIVLVREYQKVRLSDSFQSTIDAFHQIIGDSLLPLLILVFTNADERTVERNPRDTRSYAKHIAKHLSAAGSFNNAGTNSKSESSIPTFQIDADEIASDEDLAEEAKRTAKHIVITAFTNHTCDLWSVLEARTREEQLRDSMEQLQQEVEKLRKRQLEAKMRTEQLEAERRLQERDRLRQKQLVEERVQEMVRQQRLQQMANLQHDFQSLYVGANDGGGRGDRRGREQRVWVAGNGIRYHDSEDCAGGGGSRPKEVTISSAKRSGRTACKKCT